MGDNDDELNLKGPGGLGFMYKGQQLFAVILLLLLAAFFFWLNAQSESKADVRSATTLKAIEQMTVSNVKAEATQRAMIYVLSLSQVERERLNLMKPQELQAMQALSR